MIQLLGIPYDKNSSFLRGPAMAPQRIRLMDVEGSANRFCEHGTEIIEGINYQDLGDLKLDDDEPKVAYTKIKDRVANVIRNGNRLISFGGDHSISFPVIEAHCQQYSNLHVLHLDAHGDLYHDFGGNPFSHASPFARLMEKELVASLTQVGIRTLTKHQKEQAKRFGVECIEMKDFNMSFLTTLKGPLYISLDIDVLDPAYAPGISHHEPGGMSTRQVLEIIHNINVPIVGADIVELNPQRDLNNATAMVAYKFFKEIASKMLQ